MKSAPAMLGAITVAAVLVHGYHLGVDDAAIYVPAIKRVADPGLYPFGEQFFMSHAHLSVFALLVGGSARLSHLPVDAVIFAWHVLSIFALLLAAWQLLGCCFESRAARWSGVALLAATLSVPVTGTALAIMDPYLTARSLSTPATLFAIVYYLSGRLRWAAAWLLLTAALHPQMGMYGACFLGCMEVARRRQSLHGLAMGLAFLPNFAPVGAGPARDCLLSRSFFFVNTWMWYEWVGVFAPVALLWWFSVTRPRRTLPAFRELAAGLVPFGLGFTALAVILSIPASLEGYTRLQPMRSFHLLYVVLFILIGGLIGEYAIKASAWRWTALFVPLGLGMLIMQDATFPASQHVEWPGSTNDNSWISAFMWIRSHTPKEAVFALDADYMVQPGDDTHGFRAVAERSVLADRVKDSGAVSLFPQLAPEWERQVLADRGLDHFVAADFRKLVSLYPVTWILMVGRGAPGLICPYQNRDLAVCRM
uniref:Glycosyltransferase RgtA/B/C/D-like domain-containing protein n=1 Tax=Solibacter usitatus (strain Ellin6076) TaxID=234267 RepID=Q01QJ0_SOLUE